MNHNENKQKQNVVGTLITGVAIGAAATMLARKENTEKLKKVVGNIKDAVSKTFTQAQREAQDMWQEGRERVLDGVDRVKNATQDIADTAHDKAKDAAQQSAQQVKKTLKPKHI